MNKKELEKLKKKMPRNYGVILQEKTGKNIKSIYMALSGVFHSDTIIDAAIELADETQKKNEIKSRKKQKILNN